MRHRQPVTVVIPRLRVRAPVYEGGVSQSGVLTIVPGYALTHLRFSADLGQQGNYVLYGHDDIEGEILRDLPAMRAGDLIYLYQGSSRFIYQVVASRIVPPTDVAVLNATDSPILTLISCFPYMVDTERIVVQAALI
jgi:sortase A